MAQTVDEAKQQAMKEAEQHIMTMKESLTNIGALMTMYFKGNVNIVFNDTLSEKDKYFQRLQLQKCTFHLMQQNVSCLLNSNNIWHCWLENNHLDDSDTLLDRKSYYKHSSLQKIKVKSDVLDHNDNNSNFMILDGMNDDDNDDDDILLQNNDLILMNDVINDDDDDDDETNLTEYKCRFCSDNDAKTYTKHELNIHYNEFHGVPLQSNNDQDVDISINDDKIIHHGLCNHCPKFKQIFYHSQCDHCPVFKPDFCSSVLHKKRNFNNNNNNNDDDDDDDEDQHQNNNGNDDEI